MAGRLWHLIRHGLPRLRWPLAGLAALAVVLACVLVIPQWLVRWELGAATGTLTAAEKARAINDVRATLLQGIGGAVILLGAYLTYRQLQTGREQLQIAQQGQVTERFSRAIDQLGHGGLDVRLGGIYALERIANDFPDDRATIAEVLTAFVRGHAPWPPRLPGQYCAKAPIEEVPELQVRAPDLQAALTVLARRQLPPKPSGRLDLHATDLRKAILDGANLREADLDSANLHEASLNGANLWGADLNEANLQRAHLGARANLQMASLSDADLQGAFLSGAQLQHATLTRVNLQRAVLNGAQLQGADLEDAQLQEAFLMEANLQGTHLFGASLLDADLYGTRLYGAVLQGASLFAARLENARADLKTVWPEGFDAGRAGVVLIDARADAADEPER
jgi:uncharacterized protein YjbI with pentapeptide repeats